MKDTIRKYNLCFVALMSAKIGIVYFALKITHLLSILLTIMLIGSMTFVLLNMYNKKRYIIIFDFILTLIWVVDINFNSYFGSLPYISYLSNLEFLIDAKASLIAAMIWWSFLLFVNIPFYKFVNEVKPNKKHKKIRTIIILLNLVVIVILCNLPVHDIRSSELITYHVRDLSGMNRVEITEYLAKDSTDKYIIKKYTGIGQGKNVIIIQLEAFQNFLINIEYEGEEVTPNLNKLITQDSFYFSNTYQTTSVGNTSDAEFTVLTSMYPSQDTAVFKTYYENDFYSLPSILSNQGYYSFTVHGNDGEYYNRELMYPSLGFDRYYDVFDFEDQTVHNMGIYDEIFFEESIGFIEEIQEPFFGMFITVSTHYPFNIGEKPTDLVLNEEDVDTTFGNYINATRYTDYHLGLFIDELKKNGIYDNTVFVIYGDHYALSNEHEDEYKGVEKLLNIDYSDYEAYNIPLIITVPNSGINETIDTFTGQIDVMPTLLNLLGVEITNEQSIFGKDSLNTTQNYAPFISYYNKGSFVTEGVIAASSKIGIFDNMRFEIIGDAEMKDSKYYEEIYNEVIIDMNNSNYLLENNSVFSVIDSTVTLETEVARVDITEENLIAYAGGNTGDYSYTNSLNALNESVSDGYKYIEVDLFKTKDDEFVLLHDVSLIKSYFNEDKTEFTRDEFMDFDMIWDFEHMDLDSLVLWLESHENINIITDINADYDLELLQNIADNYPEIMDQFIPQIYHIDQFKMAKSLGFDDIIFTIYQSEDTYEEIYEFAQKENIFAITIPKYYIEVDLFQQIQSTGTKIFVDGINDKLVFLELMNIGVNGVYTDVITFE